MVTNVTSLTGNGLKDWLIQRATAVYFAIYILCLLGYCLSHPDLQYDQWRLLFTHPEFQAASIIALLTYVLHTWIGIWTVLTDYVKCTAVRLSCQALLALFLLGQFLWGIMMVWGL